MKTRKSFIKLIRFWGVIFFVAIGGSIVAVDIFISYRDFNFRADRTRKDYIARQKEMIRTEVDHALVMINHDRLQIETLARSKIKTRVYEAYAIADNIYRQNKDHKSRDEIQRMILDALGPIKFEGGTGYYFVSRLDGVLMLFPSVPEMVGGNYLDLPDTAAQSITEDMIGIVNQSGEGFYQYNWAKPGSEGDDFSKITFIKQFEPLDWFIGTALYLDDVETQIKADVLSDISRIRFGEEGYIFVNRMNGDALVSNGKLLDGTKKLWEAFGDEEKVRSIFAKEYSAALKPGGDYIYYSWEKLSDSNIESPKTSFIYGIPEWQWLIGAGVYLDDVDADIDAMATEQNRYVKARMFNFLLLIAGITIIFLIVLNWLTRSMNNDFHLFTSIFSRAAHSDEEIDRDMVRFVELDRMAEDANKMLQDLRESEEKYRKLIETTSEGFWMVSSDAMTIDVNQSLCEMLDYSRDEMIGSSPLVYVDEENSKLFEKQIATVTSTLHRTYEILLKKKNGDNFPALFNATTISDKDGIHAGSFAFVTDMTESRHAEEEMQKMEKLKSVGTLAGGIAHDFNNILTGIYGNISMAKEDIPEDNPGVKFLEEAENSMSRATRLTKQLLIYAKGGEPVKENVSIGALIEEVVRFDLSGSNVKPVFDQAEDLWMIAVDKSQMQQVFSNLAINADQAMPDGGHLFITMGNLDNSSNDVQGLDQGKYIRITVRDEGAGIDSRYLERIFDPYFTTKQTGSGLGLATAYSIIRKHGGHINVESEAGKGATFVFYLPVLESRQLEEPGQPVEDYSTDGHTGKVLVMDDEDMICRLVVRMLSKSGFSVEAANDGRQAIEMYEKAMGAGEPFDVVIMDVTIPGGIGGKEAIKKILRIDPKVRAIVSSGYANDPVMANYADYGFKGIVAKPYVRGSMLEVLNRVLGS